MGVPEGADNKEVAESLFKETISENFPNLQREMNIQIHDAPRTPNRLDFKRFSLRHIIIRFSKVKDKREF